VSLRVVVLGMMGRLPFGGQTWLYLNWLRGLDALGHDVWYVEDDSVWPYDPVQNTITDDCSYAVDHIRRCMDRIGLPDKWAFRLADRRDASWGLGVAALDRLYQECDVLLNIVGATDLREEHMAAPLRVYVETDPVTAELRLATGDLHTKEAFASHHVIATYGENYGAADCGVPLNGVSYVKTRQPVDCDLWPMEFNKDARLFTTVGNFRQQGSDVEYRGEVYRWSKHHEWYRVLDLPTLSGQEVELAVNIDDCGDRQLLVSHGWKITSPLPMSFDIFGAYPTYIRCSRGEFTVAKDQNVRLRSGWFSERDVCYLASGKPVVTQETGFSGVLPTGRGLFSFTTVDEAADAVRTINGDYESHCRAARALAQECFAAPGVASRLLVDIGLC
jgi:hypothetical protein